MATLTFEKLKADPKAQERLRLFEALFAEKLPNFQPRVTSDTRRPPAGRGI